MDKLTRVESIFFAALEKGSAEQRAAYLDEACGQNLELRGEIERLLDAHPNAGSFLNAAADFDATIDASTITESAGTVIGPYKLLQQIGEGGMGVVWMAEQTEPVRRTVALKIIKPGMDSSQVIARFEAERQALAMMDHPNIAKVLDAGTTESGRPYFVMELVKGIPITQYCDDQRLSPGGRLELLIPVCQAIQHAHQKGIIHRDIKPSNVLIASYDGRPVPKVIDFGVAKATGQKLTERTLFTGFGSIVGTLEYMSPEQAEFNALDVDTRSDIYSLGVLLYELLTGSTPLTRERLKQAAITELLRVIREEDPPPPSTRLSQSSDSLESISAQRQSDAHRLPKLVRGELDWIVMKSLEKDRTRRYETANGMARDIEHYLQNEPVEACPPSATYRLRKFVRRNKGPVVAVSLIVLALVAGVTVATWQAIRASRAQQVATAEERKAKQAAEKAITQKDRAAANAKRADANLKTANRNLYAAHTNLIHDAWKIGNVPRVLELLNQHRPKAGEEDLRSFEWHYLWQQSHRQKKTFTINRWDPEIGEQARMSAISHDGRWLASGISGRTSTSNLSLGISTLSKIKLWDMTTGSVRKTITDPSDDPSSPGVNKMYEELVFSSDGKLFATVEFDASRPGSLELRAPRITIWDLETLTLRNTIPLPSFLLGDRIVILPDNRQVAATFRSDPPQDGQRVRTFVVWDIPERPDGDKPVVGKEKFLRQVESDSQLIDLVDFAFAPDGKSILWRRDYNLPLTVASVSGEGQDGSLPITGVDRLTFSADGKYAAGCTYPNDFRTGGVAKLFDAKTGGEVHAFPAAPRGTSLTVPRAYFSPDSGTLAVQSGVTVHVWDVESKQQIGDLRGNTGNNIQTVGFGADSHTIITVSHDKINAGKTEAKIWDVNTMPGPDEFSLGKGPKRSFDGELREHNRMTGMDITPDGRMLFTAWRAGYSRRKETWVATLADLSAQSLGKRASELAPEKEMDWVPRHAAFSPDGRRMAMSGAMTHGNGHKIELWQLADGSKGFKPKLEREFPLPHFNYSSPPAAFSPDGTKLVHAASAEPGGSQIRDTLQHYDIASGQESEFPANVETWFKHKAGLGWPGADWDGSCDGLLFSSDGRRIISMHDHRRRIVVWDAEARDVLSVLESSYETYGSGAWKPLALSPDDQTLAACLGGHTIYLWDVSEAKLREVHDELERRAENKYKKPTPTEPASKPKAILRGHADMITAIAFHPGGKVLASASYDRTIKLWDTITGEVRLTLEGHQANIIALAFTPDGATLISGDGGGTVKLWRATE